MRLVKCVAVLFARLSGVQAAWSAQRAHAAAFAGTAQLSESFQQARSVVEFGRAGVRGESAN